MSYEPSIIAPCENCGTLFKSWAFKRATGEGRFCSRGCYIARRRAKAREQFWTQVDKTGPWSPLTHDYCWHWTGPLNRKGYGITSYTIAGTPSAHRTCYILCNGEIPRELVIDHLCRNRSCVRPSHMEPVTNRENIMRGEGIAVRRASQTHCSRGHALSGENVYYCRGRQCRTCNRARKGAWQRADRAAKKLAACPPGNLP